VGGLYSVTALRENDQERGTVYTKHRLKLHLQTTLTNDGGLKNLDTRGDGGRIGEIVLHIGGSAVAPEGVLRHVHPLGDSPRRCLADGGARVPKVLPSAELEGILAGLIIAVPLEPSGGAAVSNDVEEPQELAVEPPAGGDDAG